MIERRDRLSFALETAARRFIRQVVPETLDRDRPVQFLVTGSIDGSHAAFAENGLDAEGPESRAGADRALFVPDGRHLRGHGGRTGWRAPLWFGFDWWLRCSKR
jgi:hypothetical protein